MKIKNKSKFIFILSITSVILVSIILGIVFITNFDNKPDNYPELTYKNDITRYFENNNSLLCEDAIIPNSLEKFYQNFNYTENGVNYDTQISLALNSFFKIAIDVIDGEFTNTSTGFLVSNGFRVKIYFSPLDSYTHDSVHYSTIKQIIETGNIYFEYKAADADNYIQIYNLEDLYIYETENPENVDYFNDLNAINFIATNDESYLLIENDESDDGLFHKLGDYRIRVTHRSRWASSGARVHSEYFSEQTVFTTIKKTDSKINNIVVPESHTLQELFYTLRFENLDKDCSFILSDSINLPKLSGNPKLFFDSNCFITRYNQNKKYSCFLVEPSAVVMDIYFQADSTYDIKKIYSITNFINEHETLKLTDRTSKLSYYQPANETLDLTTRISLNVKGIYCVKISYKVQSLICKTLQPVGDIIKCEDVYFFELI